MRPNSIAMMQQRSDATFLGEWIDFADDGRENVAICQRKYDMVARKLSFRLSYRLFEGCILPV